MCVCTSKADTTAQNCKIIYFVRYCNERKQRQFWVRSIFNTERKLQQGASDNLIKEMLAEDMEKVGHNTISKIISETCEAIWKCLKDSVFPKDDKESWKTVADEFERL
ncbi:PREDICTED: uncharacterized protein LOC108745356 [Trachymyrmex septentrionalis]|uniref:uncharacterized protein LOC108745356 n=1 Tax=Trachymyrmex septentrionalis TaxID=34720 RepID=UPI00084EE4EF|nr:PREDICTED: uncharacterized protein LOC108745356 [Trachymyrmex septentrionalis]